MDYFRSVRSYLTDKKNSLVNVQDESSHSKSYAS